MSLINQENRRPFQAIRKPLTEKPKGVKFEVSYDFYRPSDGIGDHAVRDDKFYHQGICQVMYPKELVYPRSGGEASLEMIRAKMEKYQVLPEDVNDSVMEFTCMPGDPINTLKGLPVYKGRSNVEHPIQLAQDPAPQHSSLNKLLQSQQSYAFTPQGGPGWNHLDHSSRTPQKMLSFSDSRSYTSNFSAYDSSVSLAGGTFKVFEDSSCVDQPSSARPGKQSMRASRATNLSSVMESTNQGSFQVYEDSMQSIHASRRLDNSSQLSVKQAAISRQPLKVLKDLKDNDSVDTESLLEGNFEVYQDSPPDDQPPSGVGWPMAGRQGGTAPTVAAPPPVEKAQSGLFPWVAEPSQPATMHNIGDVMSGGVQADPLPTQSQTVFEESVTMADIPRPMLPLSKFSSTPNHWEKTASVLPSLDVTNVQCELGKLKLDPSYPEVEAPKSPTEDLSAPAGQGGGHTFFHQPWKGMPMETIAEVERESYSSGSSASIGAMNSTAGRNLYASSVSTAVPTPLYSAKGNVCFNPFKLEAVQFMLSAVGGSPVPRRDEDPPQPLEQSYIDLGMQCHLMNKIGEGGFAVIYKAVTTDSREVAVKIQQPADQWECAVLKEVRRRLDEEQPSVDKELFVKVLSACILADTSFLVLPLYHCGTLLDVINSQPVTSEASALAYVADILLALSALHSIGILHGDIKPDNLFIREQSAGGPTLALGDFSRAVDLRAFPRDVAFTGTSYTSSFECEQMKRNEPWKYQVDTYAVATTVHIVAHHNYNFCVLYNENTKEYTARRKVPRYWHQLEWQSLLRFLLNTSTHEEPDYMPWIAKLSELAHACRDDVDA